MGLNNSMLFNSLEFAIFLSLVFFLHWFMPAARKVKAQNLVILLASYVFYGWWDWRFLFLMLFSTSLDFAVGLALSRTSKLSKRKALLYLSVVSNVALLCFFKYYNFFVDSLIEGFAGLNIDLGKRSLNVILPIGISFYTFQTIGYTVDVYRKKVEATKDVLAYFTFVSFFPQLVAGPIERAQNLLPQFGKTRVFDYTLAKDGLRQILWGLFKKVVIADVIGVSVDKVFLSYDLHSGSTLFVGALLFAVQVYADFSAYADIAIGTGKLFGIRLMRNFNYPFFSTSFGEFWRRWHISLSLWFRDYVYIPLGGGRKSNLTRTRNIMIVFLLSGIWHGSNDLNFVVFGLAQGFLVVFSGYFISKTPDATSVSNVHWIPDFRQFCQMIVVFLMFAIPLIFFRAPTLDTGISYFSHMFSTSLLSRPMMLSAFVPVIVLLLIEWFHRHKEHPLTFDHWPALARWGVYYLLIFYISKTHIVSSPYIYFQF